jgi:hypothetical protein
MRVHGSETRAEAGCTTSAGGVTRTAHSGELGRLPGRPRRRGGHSYNAASRRRSTFQYGAAEVRASCGPGRLRVGSGPPYVGAVGQATIRTSHWANLTTRTATEPRIARAKKVLPGRPTTMRFAFAVRAACRSSSAGFSSLATVRTSVGHVRVRRARFGEQLPGLVARLKERLVNDAVRVHRSTVTRITVPRCPAA